MAVPLRGGLVTHWRGQGWNRTWSPYAGSTFGRAPPAGPARCPFFAVVPAGPAAFFSQIHLCRKKVASRSCHFYNNVEGKRGVVKATPAGRSVYSQVGMESVQPLRPLGLLALPFGLQSDHRLN